MKKLVITILLASLFLTGCASNTNNTKEQVERVETTETINSVETINNDTEDISTEAIVEDTEVETESVAETSEVVEDTENAPKMEVKSETSETAVDETVWVNTYSNLRSGPATTYDVLGTANYGDSLHRIGVLSNGWSKVEYNSSIAYINSKLIQTDEIVKTVENNPTSSTESVTPTEQAQPQQEATTQTSSTLCTGVAKEIFDATNAERIAAGLSPLTWSDELARCADIRAGEIITTFSHTRPDGSKAYSLSNLVAGENIIRGPHATGQEMVAQWMASEGHRANILYADYKTIGISTRCTDQGDTACQLFGY